MSLEAWGDCDSAAEQPMRECGYCHGLGDIGIDWYWRCPNCKGTGEVPDVGEPLDDLYEQFKRDLEEDKGEWPVYTGPGK